MACSSFAGYPAPSASITHGVWQPVPAGSYRATLITKNAVPLTCQEKDDVVDCNYWAEDPYDSPNGGSCHQTIAATADFELPQEGDVLVPVAI